MASNLLAMASNPLPMASNLLAVASNLLPMASNLLATVLQPKSNGLQPTTDGLLAYYRWPLQPTTDGPQPAEFLEVVFRRCHQSGTPTVARAVPFPMARALRKPAHGGSGPLWLYTP